MSCPSEISSTLLAMIELGLLRIRALAWSGQTDLIATEADHLHNLPALIADYDPERLKYYWEVERPSYIGQMPVAHVGGWEPLWTDLRPFTELLGTHAP
jgi:hypothetical protein